MKKTAPYLLLILLAGLVFFSRTCRYFANSPGRGNQPVVTNSQGIDRNVENLEYTQHARCRMDCRHITAEEVKYILHNGEVNFRKSDMNGHPCPTYALEGYSAEHQHLRIVFAQCEAKTKVVTCIDLDNEFECHCPGDENKH